MVATHFDMLQRRAARCNTQHRRSRASATTVRRASGHRLEPTLASAPMCARCNRTGHSALCKATISAACTRTAGGKARACADTTTVGSLSPRMHQDWARPPPTSAPGLGSALPHLHQDWATRCADYVVDQIFRLDGTIKFKVGATGVDAMRSRRVRSGRRVADADDGVAHETQMDASRSAPFHDHFFNYRIDLDVDGQVASPRLGSPRLASPCPLHGCTRICSISP